jgi:hypothetical protein
MKIKLDTKQFMKDMNNIISYSNGFLDGIESGKTIFFKNLGENMSEILKQYIDSAARSNPDMLHHIYEWYQEGNPGARLYDINYISTSSGLSFGASFRQSSSIANGSKVPFYDKARIIENGLPVTIKPINARVLAFNDNGEQVFTPNPVTVLQPGGIEAQGGFEKIWNEFFKIYISQSFLDVTGLRQYFKDPAVYKRQLNAGKKFGRTAGFSAGLRWMSNAGGTILE